VESAGQCSIQVNSVYGAAVAIPQIARSAGWPKSLCGLVFRSSMFMVLNFALQILFVYYIYDSQTNMNPFGGQMHLCDFASHINNCPNAPNCIGPGGEVMSDASVIYPFDIWYTRKFVRDAMLQIFPDKTDQINTLLDPGEYGVESNYCRLLCVLVFVLQIVDEFTNIMDFARLLRRMPTVETAWIEYEVPPDHIGADPHGSKHLEYCHFVVSGMPMRWKIFNLFFILIPRIFIWRMLAVAGVHFLMETAAMVDQIVNTTALSFVLETDEVILDRLGTKATKYMMRRLENHQLFDHTPFEGESQDTSMKRYGEEEMRWWAGRARFPIVPRRLIWTFVLAAFFLAEYYFHNCAFTPDGSLISIDVSIPESAHLSFRQFVQKFFSIPEVENPETAFWTWASVT